MRLIFLIFLVVNILFACSEQDRILPGKREDAATSFGFSDQDKKQFTKSNAIKLPPMKVNDQWRLIASAESKNYPNLMLDENLSEIGQYRLVRGIAGKKDWLRIQFSLKTGYLL